MIDVLLQPLAFSFMQKALIIGLIIAMPTAFLSCFLIVKGWSLMGDAISHAILPGVVLAYLLNFPLVIGAFAAGMCCALTTGYVAENCRVKRDTIMGVVFSGMFALGLVLYTGIETDVHLDHILFGNMLGVDSTDLFTALTISICVSLFLMARWPDLLLGSFDPVQASAIGLNVVTSAFWTACRTVDDDCRHIEGGWSHIGDFTSDRPWCYSLSSDQSVQANDPDSHCSNDVRHDWRYLSQFLDRQRPRTNSNSIAHAGLSFCLFSQKPSKTNHHWLMVSRVPVSVRQF